MHQSTFVILEFTSSDYRSTYVDQILLSPELEIDADGKRFLSQVSHSGAPGQTESTDNFILNLSSVDVLSMAKLHFFW
jgi:hypothetical protein